MKKNKAITGTYYLKIRSQSWYLYFQSFKEGRRKQEAVDKKAYRDLGFRFEMSLDQAKLHCVQLNKERSHLKEKIRLAAKNFTQIKSLNETLFPLDQIQDFLQLLEDENFGSADHLKKMTSHFNFIQKMCNELRILPIEYKESSKRIYKYFIKKKVSPSYSGRLISLLNRWGRFRSKQMGAFFEEVPVPRGREKSAIADAQQTKSGKDTELGVRTESIPLSPLLLNQKREQLIPEQFNWLLLSVWFGLRPEEVDLLLDSKRFKIEENAKYKVKVLHVYQSKLQSIAEDRRWKIIPVLYPEQVESLEIIVNKNFKRPLHKTVRKYLGKGITLYGGRKGFVDLMLNLGQRLEDISMWLGHKDISTTWAHYKDRQEVSFTPLADNMSSNISHFRLVK